MADCGGGGRGAPRRRAGAEAGGARGRAAAAAARRTSTATPRRFSSAAEALAAASSTPSMPPKFMTARDMEANLRAFMQAIDARVEALHATVAAAAGRLERDRVSKINRTLVRWFVVHTAKAVQGWKEVVARTRRLRGAAAAQWRDALLARVYRTWVALVLEGRSVRHQARRALGHWVNRLASLCFVAWGDAAREAAEVRRALLGRAVGRMLHRLLAATFVPWCDHVVKMKASRALGRRVVARMQNALLAVTFDAWTDAVADARASRVERLRGAAGRLLHRTAALAFGGWRDGARAQVEERHATLAAVVQRMMNRLACFAFDEWVTWLARRTEVKRRAAYAIGPGRLQGLVWRTWRAAVVEARRERERQWVIDLIGESAPAGGGEPSEALAACLEGLAQLRTEVAVRSAARERRARGGGARAPAAAAAVAVAEPVRGHDVRGVGGGARCRRRRAPAGLGARAPAAHARVFRRVGRRRGGGVGAATAAAAGGGNVHQSPFTPRARCVAARRSRDPRLSAGDSCQGGGAADESAARDDLWALVRPRRQDEGVSRPRSSRRCADAECSARRNLRRVDRRGRRRACVPRGAAPRRGGPPPPPHGRPRIRRLARRRARPGGGAPRHPRSRRPEDDESPRVLRLRRVGNVARPSDGGEAARCVCDRPWTAAGTRVAHVAGGGGGGEAGARAAVGDRSHRRVRASGRRRAVRGARGVS